MTSNIDELITCQICFEFYDNSLRLPKQLPCQHVYCLACLNSLFNEQQQGIQCPHDRNFYTINSLNDIPASRLVLNLLDVYRPSQSRATKTPPKVTPSYTSNTISILTPSVQPPTPAPPPPLPQRPAQIKQTKSIKIWDPDAYLRDLFNNVDADRSGLITLNELHEALKCGQSNLQFDLKTTQLIFNKYDHNHDGSICFSEFKEVFNYINEEQLKFLCLDLNNNETLDTNEFKQALRSRLVYELSDTFIHFLVNTIQTRMTHGLRFDIYCRVIARLDYLCDMYSKATYFKQFKTLESYLHDTFFYDFF